MAVWTAIIITIATLFHPDTVVGCQIQLIVMGLAIAATGVVIVVFNPLATTSSNWFACCSRACVGLVFFCAAASLEEMGHPAKTAASSALYAFGIALLVITIAQLVLLLFGLYAELQIEVENLGNQNLYLRP